MFCRLRMVCALLTAAFLLCALPLYAYASNAVKIDEFNVNRTGNAIKIHVNRTSYMFKTVILRLYVNGEEVDSTTESFLDYGLKIDNPKNRQEYSIVAKVFVDGEIEDQASKTVVWGVEGAGDGDGSDTEDGTPGLKSDPIEIFPEGAWERCMFWYTVLAALSGVFIFFTLLKTGYGQMAAAVNPGVRASFMETVQRCIIAVGFIALAPVFIKILIGLNNEAVKLIAQVADRLIGTSVGVESSKLGAAGMFEKVITGPLETLVNLINYTFGLRDPNAIIFNGHLKALAPEVFMGTAVSTGNVFGDVILKMAFVGFNVYFNAVYTIRRWVTTAVMAVTPLIAWIWAFTGERQILEIWSGEVIQTIFMQVFHALTLGVFLSIACGTASAAQEVSVGWFVTDLKTLGLWVAGFGGAVCLCVVIYLAFRLVLARGERDVAEVKAGFTKALTGLAILGLSLMVAGFLAVLLGGNWGVKWSTTPH